MRGVLTGQTRQNRILVAVKAVHTIVWALFVGCILAIPVMGWLGRFRAAWMLSVIVFGECLALGVNHGRCPLTPIAARFTTERHLGFDIYLPGWLAPAEPSAVRVGFRCWDALCVGREFG